MAILWDSRSARIKEEEDLEIIINILQGHDPLLAIIHIFPCLKAS
jgi:hypothetical protein